MYLPTPNETEFELPPAGTYLAVCYRVIDLGTQQGSYNGQPKTAHKILVSWELPEETMKDGRPFTISQRYTWSMSEKATLRKHLEAWRGLAFTEKDFGPQGFNVKNIISKVCVLTITHAEKGEKKYANIAAVGKPMKGMAQPSPTNETAYLWLVHDGWSAEVFHKLSQGLQGVIMQAPEYRELVNGYDDSKQPVAEEGDFHNDPIPF